MTSSLPALRDDTFHAIRALMHQAIGLHFTDSKKTLISSRLGPRIQRLGLGGYEDYVRLIDSPDDGGEFQMAVDLLTTNETYFFREPAHFDAIEAELARTRPRTRAVWSAASSFGDEAYSIAMLLADEPHRRALQRMRCRKRGRPFLRQQHKGNGPALRGWPGLDQLRGPPGNLVPQEGHHAVLRCQGRRRQGKGRRDQLDRHIGKSRLHRLALLIFRGRRDPVRITRPLRQHRRRPRQQGEKRGKKRGKKRSKKPDKKQRGQDTQTMAHVGSPFRA